MSDPLEIDDELIDRLLRDQMPQWHSLPRKRVETGGTDNVLVRMGDELVMRLPRTQSASLGIVKEQRFVPELARQLDVSVPLPVAIGAPDSRYPSPWSICRWLPGENPEAGAASVRLAADLGRFVCKLHSIDSGGLTSEGLLHSYRAEKLARRNDITRWSIDQCEGILDRNYMKDLWSRTSLIEESTGPPVWTHADLHPCNILTNHEKLTAIIDWGCLVLGDGALDCLAAWSLLTPTTRPTFRETGGFKEAAWLRGRAWALSIALVALPYYFHSNRRITAWATHVVEQVARDVAGE